jgi:uncharacterized protein (DUF1015 family)
MVELRPFRGILFNEPRIGDLSRVVCPPYDVISLEEQEAYYSLHPCNVIRIDLGRVFPGDSGEETRYTRAARFLDEWLSDGILIQEKARGYYLLEETFLDPEGRPVTRQGLIGLLRLEEDRPGASVRLHEFTHAGPKEDRFELMKATSANLSQVFALYQDPSGFLADSSLRGQAGCGRGEAVGKDGVKRRMFFLGEPAVQRRIEAFFEEKSLFIADGHHRYETALAYRTWRRGQEKKAGRQDGWDYIMVYVTNSESPGLRVYPTHRILTGYPRWDPDGFLRSAREVFEIQEMAPAEDPDCRKRFFRWLKEAPDGASRIGCLFKDHEVFFLLSIRDPVRAASLFPSGMHALMRSLDVSILHTVLLGRILGMSREEQENEKHLLYVKGEDAALEALNRDQRHQAAFLLGPPAIRNIMELSGLGIRMPQKTTYFYPKLLTGLVLRRILED